MTSGGCEILHADCIEVLQTLAENSFDALITDPPYSSGGQYRGDRKNGLLFEELEEAKPLHLAMQDRSVA